MLWLDVGNTRLKWQLDTDLGVVAGASLHASGEDLASAPIWANLPAGTTVWVASVVSSALRARIETCCALAGCSQVNWAVSSASLAGLQNSYADPQRLGVDRWLTMLAAWCEDGGPFVVIDAGSAITVDWVDATGRHRGGHIVPGLGLLEQALRRGTAAVRADPGAADSLLPGISTDEAVNHGVLAMAAGYLRFVLTEAWPDSLSARVLLCGGDGPLLEPFLPRPAIWRAQLVLDGLRDYARLQGNQE